MARVFLITGGARSGKSSYAERLALPLGGRKAYLATAPALDAEMELRIARHRERRVADGWTTLEEQFEPAGTIMAARGRFDLILVDCLTLWINNLLYRAERNGEAIDESAMSRRCEELRAACAAFEGTVIFVINEVGFGIVPDNPLARCFRDLSGRCSQSIAVWADRVTLVCCGLPLELKK